MTGRHITSPIVSADLPELAALWQRDMRAQNLSPKTIRGYMDTVGLFDAYLIEQGMPRALARITREHVAAFIEAQLGRYKPATAVARYSGYAPSPAGASMTVRSKSRRWRGCASRSSPSD